ncbi:hypothetical protein BJ508DRAFT_305042 [Ascobolus immersus RN42]|uniref:F-box domain-containing protein n=1 Tax=Ascobolus immersus RN42 TaxID=1160509 RepID=A0A3N4IFR9_ASCIM|nr:hypothetical protein BJ508DRAFT_305042 [Ascobolus immersus RN42]
MNDLLAQTVNTRLIDSATLHALRMTDSAESRCKPSDLHTDDASTGESSKLYEICPSSSLNAFLKLPIELRLEVYSHCSALTLIQLARASPLFEDDLEKYPNIVSNSYYCVRSDTHFTDLFKAYVARAPVDDTPGYTKLNHLFFEIYQLRDFEEVQLFRRLYIPYPSDFPSQLEMYVCEECLWIRTAEESLHTTDSRSEHFFHDICINCLENYDTAEELLALLVEKGIAKPGEDLEDLQTDGRWV